MAQDAGAEPLAAPNLAQQRQRRSLEDTIAKEPVAAMMPSATPKARTKVVIRRMPPSLTEHQFLESIQEKFAEAYNYFYFVPGKTYLLLVLLLGNEMINVIPRRTTALSRNARAYLNFNTPEQVLAFHKIYEDHVILDAKGVFPCL